MINRQMSILAIGLCFFQLIVTVLPVLAAGKKMTVSGYVLDSACLFTKNLQKPISSQCALECAAGGSPLVILSGDGTVYWPIDSKMPAQGQNYRLIKVAGKFVKISGEVFEKGSSKAIVMDTIEESAAK